MRAVSASYARFPHSPHCLALCSGFTSCHHSMNHHSLGMQKQAAARHDIMVASASHADTMSTHCIHKLKYTGLGFSPADMGRRQLGMLFVGPVTHSAGTHSTGCRLGRPAAGSAAVHLRDGPPSGGQPAPAGGPRGCGGQAARPQTPHHSGAGMRGSSCCGCQLLLTQGVLLQLT